MFDIGWSELLVIGIVALVVIGPKELPGVLRTVGQMVGKLRRMAGEFQGQFQEALREAELDGLKKDFTDFAQDANKSIAGALPSNPLLDFENEVKSATAAIEGRKDEPATKVEDATAEAQGIDPVTGQPSTAESAAAAVEAQLPKPEAAEPYPFEDIAGSVAGAAAPTKSEAVTPGHSKPEHSKPEPSKPEPLPAAETKPVEAGPLETKPGEAKPAAEPDKAASAAPEAAPKRRPRAAAKPDAGAAQAALEGAPADLAASDLGAEAPAKPKRKPRVVVSDEAELSEAVASLDDRPEPVAKAKRKPRVKPRTQDTGDEGPGAA